MAAGPLDGLLVVDFTRLLPGPLAARLLADLGARVVKVEEPEIGDPVRWAPPMVDGVGSLARLLLAGVESVALDLGRAPARRVAERLAGRADVVLESFRPGALARLGLDPEELRRRHPRLVVASLSGWGQSGPHADRAGHDLTYQAVAGTLASTEEIPNVPAADLAGAWALVTAVLAALVGRASSGRGARIDAALLDAALHSGLGAWAAESGGARGAGERLPLTGALPCYRLYRTRDGRQIALAALERTFWRRFCRAVDRPDLARAQYAEGEAAHRRVAELAAGRTLAEWRELFRQHDLPAEPVLTPAEALGHPQVAERALLAPPDAGASRLGFPALLDGERPRAGGRVPGLGEDTAAILEELEMEEAALPPRRRRRLGIGPRPSLRRALRRALSSGLP